MKVCSFLCEKISISFDTKLCKIFMVKYKKLGIFIRTSKIYYFITNFYVKTSLKLLSKNKFITNELNTFKLLKQCLFSNNLFSISLHSQTSSCCFFLNAFFNCNLFEGNSRINASLKVYSIDISVCDLQFWSMNFMEIDIRTSNNSLSGFFDLKMVIVKKVFKM